MSSSVKNVNLNWPTMRSVLPNGDDSWAKTAIKIVVLVISLPCAFLMDLFKLAAAKFQGKKEEASTETVKPKLTWKDKARDLTRSAWSMTTSAPENIYRFVASHKAMTTLTVGSVATVSAGIYYRNIVWSHVPAAASLKFWAKN